MQRIALGVAVILGSVALLAQNGGGKDPSAGTWRINLQKSTYSPGPPPKVATIRTYEVRPDGFTVMTQAVLDNQAPPNFSTALYKTDGKEYPVYSSATLPPYLSGGAKPKATTAVKMVDANTVTRTNKAEDGVVTMLTRVIAKDGKTMTETTTGTNAQSQAIKNVVVWDRVK